MTTALRGDPFTEREVATLRDILSQLESLDDLVGGWSTKVDARQTGFSLHVKFDKKVSVFDAITVSHVFENAPLKLCQIVARVIGQLDSRPTPLLKEGDEE